MSENIKRENLILDTNDMEVSYGFATLDRVQLDNSVQKIHREKKEKIKYLCQDCIKTFKNPTSLTKHYSEVHGIKVHACRQCPTIFKVLSELFLHARREHIDIKKNPKNPNEFAFHCNQDGCTYMTNNGTTLKHHILAHTGEKPHKCDLCGKGFAQKSNMITHRSRHVTEKIFSCDVCKTSYKSYDIYLSHLRTREHELREHLEESSFSQLKIYCNGCHEYLKNISDIKHHVNNCVTNTDIYFSCETCQIVINDFDVLNEHIKNHLDKIPITCPICKNIGFETFTKLNHHITRSHDIKVSLRHVCRYCEMKFDEETEMNEHIIRNHSDVVNSRKSHGKIGHFACKFAGCNFTANTEMLIQNHIVKHETGKLEKKVRKKNVIKNSKTNGTIPLNFEGDVQMNDINKVFESQPSNCAITNCCTTQKEEGRHANIPSEYTQYNFLKLEIKVEDFISVQEPDAKI